MWPPLLVDRLFHCCLCTLLLAQPADTEPAGVEPPDAPTVLLVVGAAGLPELGAQFDQWANNWEQAAHTADARFVRIGPGSVEGRDDRDALRQQLQQECRSSKEPLWVVLIGHGTFDGQVAKFNLQGPDVSATELAEWLKPCQRPLAIINCASASAPFINSLSSPTAVVVTSTKSGFEYQYSRFGQYLSAAIADESSDLDKDQQVSLLEAFLAASAEVRQFYAQQGRLATEHALIDDNGDGLGTPADWFRGVRAIRAAKEGAVPDGLRSNQLHLIRNAQEQKLTPEARRQRDRLEQEVAELRQRKDSLADKEYYDQLEGLLLQLARLYESLEQPADAAEPP